MSEITRAIDHSIGCDWHFEQYPHECNCGAVSGKLGTITIDRQLFEAMYATLHRKRIVFNGYAFMHTAKASKEGHEKARRNSIHAKDIEKVVERVGDIRKVGQPTIFLDILDRSMEDLHQRGQRPVAFVMTADFWNGVKGDLQQLGALTPSGYPPELTIHEYKGCEVIIVSDEGMWHSGILCCAKDSPVLAAARAAKRDG